MFCCTYYRYLAVKFTTFVIECSIFTMELSDSNLLLNRHWDPSYLHDIMSQDFFDFSELWNQVTSDQDIVNYANEVDRYSPVVEEISMDDSTLCQAVESIEKE